MTKSKRQQLTLKVHQVFQLLLEHPGGLSTKDLWSQLQQTPHAGNGNGSNANGANGASLSFEELSFFCVGPIKAGWLVVERNHWTVSPEGKKAFASYSSPQQLIAEAGKRSTQGWLATQFPGAYSAAGKAKDQVTSEVRTIRRVGASRLLKETFGKPVPWQEVLPVQCPRTIEIPLTNEDLIAHIQSLGANYREGSHAIYLSPSSLKSTALSSLAADYPANAGIKIMKNPGSLDQSSYLMGRAKGDSSIQLGMVHTHRHLSLVANLLHAKGLGPRLYDLINLKCGEQIRSAYVVQDVGNRMPSLAQCEAGIEALRKLDAEGFIRIILPAGFDDEEFECPSCCNNALVDSQGRFQYIDFQNFLLGDYEKFLTGLALAAAEQTHFGDTNALRGGRYLYQTVPGLKLPAKRNVANRMKTLTRLLEQAGVSVAERLVLDVGCNIGMMMSEYLRLGAKWCHGWDRATTVPHTERMLLALGCTRFSTTGTDITRSHVLTNDLPPNAASSLQGCVVSYLAVRGHLDWLDSLGQIPWSFMIYEGHEGETAEDFENYLADLRKLTGFELGPVSTYVDGDSEERMVAILLKTA